MNAEEQQLLDDPSISYWLKERIRDLDKRDAFDMMADLSLLKKLSEKRWKEYLKQDHVVCISHPLFEK